MTTDDDIRQLRAALRGVLGTADPDAVPTPDPEWRHGWPALAELGLTAFCVPEAKDGYGMQSAVAAGPPRSSAPRSTAAPSPG